MKSIDLLMIIAIIAVVFAAVNLVIIINKIGGIETLTGFAIDTGTANLSITGVAQVNFTTYVINWGSGYVNASELSCELNTNGINNCTDFTTVSTGLILENIGNVNVTLNLSSDKNAASFIGGSDVTPIYEWNVSNNEAGSCVNGTGFVKTEITTYTTVTTTPQLACEQFGYDTLDTLEIDLKVVIPSDAAGTKGSVITATATAIS